jgi:hypothetical protein
VNVEIGTEAPIFLFWEYLFQIFGILSLQCGPFMLWVGCVNLNLRKNFSRRILT